MTNLHVEESSRMTRREISVVLFVYNANHTVVLNRSRGSLLREWAAHKLLYRLGLWKARTLSCDFNLPQSFTEKVGYLLVGGFALLLYR